MFDKSIKCAKSEFLENKVEEMHNILDKFNEGIYNLNIILVNKKEPMIKLVWDININVI